MQHKQMLCVLGLTALTLTLGGCASEAPFGPDGAKGRIAARVSADGTVHDAIPATRASQASVVPEVSQMILHLEKADGTYNNFWGSATDFPADKEFTIGAYTMEAYYGALDQEGFDSPYYYGKTDLVVSEGEQTQANITATLANCMISIDYTQAFKDFFPQYSASVHSTGGEYISFVSDETRAAYVRPGDVDLAVSITKQNGLSATLEPTSFQALAQHHYHITFDVNGGATGEGVIKIIFDDSIVQEDVDVDVSDAILLVPAPTVTPKGFTSGTTLDLMEGERPSQSSMTVVAHGGLRAATLTCQSDYLLTKGWPAEIDLMNATPQQQALLQNFGLDVKGLYNRPDKMAVLDFAGVFENIAGTGTHQFTLVVKDKLGKINDPVTLKAQTTAVNMAITSLPSIGIDQTQAKLVTTFNGPDITSAMTLEYQDASGSWVKAPYTVASVSQARTRAAEQNYTLAFSVPADMRDFPIREVVHGKVKATGTLHKTGVLLSANDVDVWATHATFSVRHNTGKQLSDLLFYVSTDGTTYVHKAATINSDGTITLTGLTPGTAMSVRGTDTGSTDDLYKPCSITTEAAAQPQNNNMETWSQQEVGSWGTTWHNTIYNYIPGSSLNDYWATRNALTTHNYGHTSSTYYSSYSGTYSCTGVENGGKGVEICTVGYSGSAANTFTNVPSGWLCYDRAPGMLFMGSYNFDGTNETFSYGRPFTSRPTALTFQYKFTHKQNTKTDKFLAYVVVENRAGGKTTEIGRGELRSADEKGSWTKATVKIDYSNTKLKATHAYVVFASRDNIAPDHDKVSNRTHIYNQKGDDGPFQGYADARYIGAVLNVDQIIFTY